MLGSGKDLGMFEKEQTGSHDWSRVRKALSGAREVSLHGMGSGFVPIAMEAPGAAS